MIQNRALLYSDRKPSPEACHGSLVVIIAQLFANQKDHGQGNESFKEEMRSFFDKYGVEKG